MRSGNNESQTGQQDAMHSDALTNSNSDKFGSDRLSIPKSNHQTHMDAFKDVDYEMIDEICK